MLLLPSARAAATIGRGASNNANGIIYTPTEMNLLGAVRKYRKKDWWNFSSRLFTERATPSINLNQKHSLTYQRNSVEESFAGNQSKAVKHPKVITVAT